MCISLCVPLRKPSIPAPCMWTSRTLSGIIRRWELETGTGKGVKEAWVPGSFHKASGSTKAVTQHSTEVCEEGGHQGGARGLDGGRLGRQELTTWTNKIRNVLDIFREDEAKEQKEALKYPRYLQQVRMNLWMSHWRAGGGLLIKILHKRWGIEVSSTETPWYVEQHQHFLSCLSLSLICVMWLVFLTQKFLPSLLQPYLFTSSEFPANRFTSWCFPGIGGIPGFISNQMWEALTQNHRLVLWAKHLSLSVNFSVLLMAPSLSPNTYMTLFGIQEAAGCH